MKKLLLAFVAATVLTFPASASATVVAGSTPGCVVVTLDGADIGSKAVSVRFSTPSGQGGGTVKFWGPAGDYPRTFCVSQTTYFAEGGFGWTAVASAGGVKLGSTVF
jgi:hypothetical protein